MSAFDVAAFRAGFPSLDSGIAHFDNPGGTQTPRVVGDAIARTLTGPLSQRGSALVSQRNAEDAVAGYRSAVADLVGGDPGGVVHGRSATALTYDVSRTLARTWSPGDEIVLCELDHDSNVRPWIQAAERAGVTVRWLRLDPATAELDLSSLDEITDAHPPRRAHRGLQPPRHPAPGRDRRRAGARGRRARPRRRGAPHRARRTRHHRDGRGLPGVLGLQVLRPALRRRSSRTPPCSRRCGPTSCCPRPTWCPSGSSSARCRTSCWPASPPRST